MSILRWTYDTTDAIQTCLNKEVWWALSLVSTGMRSLQFYKLDFVERYTARSIGMKKPGCAPFPWGEHRRTLGPIQLGGNYPLLYKECGCKLKHLAVRVVRCCRCWYSVCAALGCALLRNCQQSLHWELYCHKIPNAFLLIASFRFIASILMRFSIWRWSRSKICFYYSSSIFWICFSWYSL